MHRWCMGGLILLLLTAPAMAQIETANGGVTSPWSPQLKVRSFLMRAENGDTYGVRLTGSMGLTRQDELRLALPLVHRSFRGRQVFGNGDLLVRYKRSLFQKDGVMRSDRLAVLLDTTLPIGVTDRDFPTRAQPGLETFQVGAGLVYSKIRDRHRFSVELAHRQPLGNDLAGTSRLNLAYWYRLTPAQFPEDETPLEVRGVLEVLSELRGPERGRPAGTLVWLAPGFQIHPSSEFQMEVNLLVPVAQSLRDPLGTRNLGGSFTTKFRF